MVAPVSAVETLGVELAPLLVEQVSVAVEAAQAPATRVAYESDWARYAEWCRRSGHRVLPSDPVVVAGYLVEAAELRTEAGERAYSPATLKRWVAAIGNRHRRSGFEPVGAHPLVRATLSGLRRTVAAERSRPQKQAAPLLVDDITRLLVALRADSDHWAARVRERRDSAILLLGFAGAFRRSELAQLRLADVTRHRADGLHIRLATSKTDQEGNGMVRAIPYTTGSATCPPCAYVRWLQVVHAWETGARPTVIRLLRQDASLDQHVCHGPVPSFPDRTQRVFRGIRKNGVLTDSLSGAAVHAVVRRAVTAAGYDPEMVERVGGHSLRAGFVTQAFRNGASAHAIMRQTGHTDPASLETYAREYAPLIGNAVTNIGL